ncbi:glycosyltransferase [Pseudoalteromonas rubra]|uniref:Diacylglycerol glucosyltransferase n=1 Tax=Pseudoalteromonas rubra TaxID=43658 RepID=A0A0U2PFG6_9GAMM|nr:glycosyltransferase [Pseudoalteromonas rubra]ALU45789.1 diacylglycerol glucosyltransferase [Pseudoalteromonas rubra]
MLLLYVESGAGSRALAEALASGFRKQGKTVELLSVSELLPQWLSDLLFGQYYQWCMSGKQHHSKLYASRWFYPFLYRLIPLWLALKGNDKQEDAKAVIRRHNQVVACSYYGAFFARYFARLAGHKVEVSGVLGDYQISNGWRTPLTQLFVSHQYSHPVLDWHRARGTDILPLGIPTEVAQDLTVTGKDTAKKSEAALNILLCGGGWGLGISASTVALLLAQNPSGTVTVICGQNETLQQQLRARFEQEIAQHQLQLAGFVSDMQPYYAQADIIITKAGGLTLTEAALANTCLIIHGALPGQEQHNRAVFVAQGAALNACNDQQLSDLLSQIQTSASLRSQTIMKAATLVNANASNQICHHLLASSK